MKKEETFLARWSKVLNDLSDEKAGKLAKHIFAYAAGDKTELEDAELNAIFQLILLDVYVN